MYVVRLGVVCLSFHVISKKDIQKFRFCLSNVPMLVRARAPTLSQRLLRTKKMAKNQERHVMDHCSG